MQRNTSMYLFQHLKLIFSLIDFFIIKKGKNIYLNRKQQH